ncbi:hypothetical protein DA89_2633 [Vibrio paracholerae]|nr:hypothetical protein DA89_2633 [Vibrio paracholerae]
MVMVKRELGVLDRVCCLIAVINSLSINSLFYTQLSGYSEQKGENQ